MEFDQSTDQPAGTAGTPGADASNTGTPPEGSTEPAQGPAPTAGPGQPFESAPAGPPFRPATPPSYQPFQRPPQRSGWRVFWGILLGLSFLGNLLLFLMLVGMVAFVVAGPGRLTQETVVREGSRLHKIAIIDIQGTIDDERADEFIEHVKTARRDRDVKGLVVRINSPGGTISGSDRIYHEIVKYRKETGRPAIAFMQGLAASGGYYAAVGCDKIIAEPTTITGSIGVAMSFFVVQNLLEDKLGVQPVFLKEGRKKDWPSMFRAPDPNELAYIQERLLAPAYNRFLSVVQMGRSEKLSALRVSELADGSIYEANQARDEGLIDEIGYLDEAVEMAEAMAGIHGARVIQYHRPFSFRNLLGAESATALKLDRMKLYELCAPQALYLWNAY
jgi:protease-4